MSDPAAKVHLDHDHARVLLQRMMLIRRFEERCAELYGQQKIRGFLHLYVGEEANAVGVMEALTPEDAIVATYREHGHALARGLPAAEVMAEMYGKSSGSSRGRGGSMHVFDAGRRFYGGNAIVGGGLPLAVGLALADKMQGRARVTCCFFGEGAAAEGAFHESMNLAALWNLPVLFVCENNGYAMGTALARSEFGNRLLPRMPQVTASRQRRWTAWTSSPSSARRASRRPRSGSGEGPRFLENRTYRFRAHSMFDPELYRDKAEISEWKKRCPIDRFRNWAMAAGILHEADLTEIEGTVAAEVEAAVAFAEEAPWEPVEDLLRDVVTPAGEFGPMSHASPTARP